MNRFLSVVVGAVAALFLVIAAASVKWYVWDIAVVQAGEPDRSMLFWGLPILFLGVLSVGIGVGLVVVARRMLEVSS